MKIVRSVKNMQQIAKKYMQDKKTVEMNDCQVILACATYLGDARIIDNIIMDAQGKQISMLRFP